MQFVRGKIMKWKREKSTDKYTMIEEFSELFLDAVYENNFELANIIIDDGKVDVNIKNNCGDTPLTAACQQTILIIEEKALNFINIKPTFYKLSYGIFHLEMPVPSQGHYGFHSFPVVD
jgi:hypothetical protein